MSTIHRLALAVLLPVLTAAAQEPARDRIFGEVHDGDGKAFAGITVTLLHFADPAVADPRYMDQVTATTDDRGRFHAQLLVGMPYVAWACSPVQDGTYRSTNVAAEVFAGLPVLLRETELRWQRVVRPRLDASWTSGLQFVATCRLGTFQLRTPLTLVDGTLRLPAMPADGVAILAFEGNHHVLTANQPTTLAALRSRRRPSMPSIRATASPVGSGAPAGGRRGVHAPVRVRVAQAPDSRSPRAVQPLVAPSRSRLLVHS